MHKFYSRIIKDPVTECWEWQGARQKEDYGRICGPIWNYHILVHRWSYEYHKGSIPSGQVVRHMCDNPRCANPDHLEVGSYKENSADREAGLKHMRAENNPNRKLTQHEANYIRDHYIPGTGRYNPGNSKKLAEQFGVSKDTVRLIAQHRRWDYK